jgi:hypothetical protein
MIIAHAIIGIMPVEDAKFSWFWLAGSIIPDIDHLFVLLKNKIYFPRKIVDSIRFEEKYNLKFKTKYIHSIFGAILLSLPVLFINFKGGLYFFIAYLIHLFLDYFDSDEKQYFYPLKLKVRGWLPVFSKLEIIFTIGITLVYLILKI